MLGVVCGEDRRPAIAAFFDIFRIPWEFAKPYKLYEAVLTDRRLSRPFRSKLEIRSGFRGGAESDDSVATFPKCLFEMAERCLGAMAVEPEDSLKGEVDCCVAEFRRFLAEKGVPLLELAPNPAGYAFTVCLSHDLDNPFLRRHVADRTALGMVKRIVERSFRTSLRWGKASAVARNTLKKDVAFLARLPFVYLGILPDPWSTFDAFKKIERGHRATWFVAPRRGYAGAGLNGNQAPSLRRVKYTVTQVQAALAPMRDRGDEIHTHGLDAWASSESGRDERSAIASAFNCACEGVRMHWLYLSKNSFVKLEKAGFHFDSTVGFCETVGFKSGTCVPYTPPACEHLIEIPLALMDSALFFKDYLGCDRAEALDWIDKTIEFVEKTGGVLTVNWHDRSIAAERWWDDTYAALIARLSEKPVWFAGMEEAHRFFKLRKDARFRISGDYPRRYTVELVADVPDGMPQIQTRQSHMRAIGAREGANAPTRWAAVSANGKSEGDN